MPIYEFECRECKDVQELAFKVSDCPEESICYRCGCRSKKILSKTAIQCDSESDVKWLKSAEQVIRPAHEKPWESRKDYNECLKRNNLCPAG